LAGHVLRVDGGLGSLRSLEDQRESQADRRRQLREKMRAKNDASRDERLFQKKKGKITKREQRVLGSRTQKP